MESYPLEELGKNLSQWMTARFLLPILFQEGGWEYWIQIDFPAWLDFITGKQWNFRREFPDNQLRFDWVINWGAAPPAQPCVVNIKAQGSKYQNSKFIRDVELDINKLKQADGQVYARLMLAVASDDSAYGELRDRGFGEFFKHQGTVFMYYWVTT